ncbi:AraC family transcriptional regulator [Paenibacillus sp. strain BS8-2]
MHSSEQASGAVQLDELDTTWWKLRSIEKLGSGDKGWELIKQFADSHIMIITSQGTGEISVDGKYTELVSNCTYVCTTGQLIDGSFQFHQSGSEQGVFLIKFDSIQEASTASQDLIPLKGMIHHSSPVTIWSLCESLELIWKENTSLERLRGSILFHELVYRLIRDRLRTTELGLEDALDDVKKYIELHYQEDLTIEELSGRINISQRHFVRLFKRKFGCGAIEYVTKFRIGEAQRLMRSGARHRIRDIARHVGYHDDSYFRRKFKQVTGVPPAVYISNQNRQLVAYHPELIGQLLALGFTPCAAPHAHPWTHYYRRKFNTDKVLPLSDNKAEVLRALQTIKVDCIIGLDHEVSQQEEAELRSIADVCLVPTHQRDWRHQLHHLAKFLMAEPVYVRWLADYQLKVNRLKGQIEQTIGKETMLVLKVKGLSCYIAGKYSSASVIYDDLGIPSASPLSNYATDTSISLEHLYQIQAERIIVIEESELGPGNQSATLLKLQGWHSLSAVQQGKIDILSAEPFGEYTAFTHDLLLDELLRRWLDCA